MASWLPETLFEIVGQGPAPSKDYYQLLVTRFQLCMSEELWEQIVRSSCDHITPDMRALAQDLGWRRMYFTNKLQLQRHLRKRKQRQGSQRKQSALDAHVPAAGK